METNVQMHYCTSENQRRQFHLKENKFVFLPCWNNWNQMFPCTIENWITLMKELFSEIRKYSTEVWIPKAAKLRLELKLPHFPSASIFWIMALAGNSQGEQCCLGGLRNQKLLLGIWNSHT